MFIQSRESKRAVVESDFAENCNADLFMVFLAELSIASFASKHFHIFGELKYPFGRVFFASKYFLFFCIKVSNWLELPFQSDFDERFKVYPHTSYLSFFLHGHYFWLNFSPHKSA